MNSFSSLFQRVFLRNRNFQFKTFFRLVSFHQHPIPKRNISNSINAHAKGEHNSSFSRTRFDLYNCNLKLSRLGQQDISKARHLFDLMPQRDVVTYSTMITICLKNGNLQQAESLFLGMPERNVVVESAMIDGYGKAGQMDKAQKVFDEMSVRNVFTWTSLLSGYSRSMMVDEARQIFDSMPEKNVVTWTTMLLGYARNGLIAKARELFEQMPEKNVVSWTAMIRVYVESKKIDEARVLFNKMPDRNMYTWNIMLLGCLNCEQTNEAIKLFNMMPQRNSVTWTTMITGLAENGFVDKAREFFDLMPKRDIAAWNAMIKAYIDERLMPDARHLFGLMPESNIITWNTMLHGFVKNGFREEAVQLFLIMMYSKVKLNEATLTSMLLACESIIEIMQIHALAVLLGFNLMTSFTNAVVSAYSRMGDLILAQLAFEEIKLKDVVSWTTIILAYAKHGCGHHALEAFGQMLKLGADPSGITFKGVLTACSHCGLVKKGRMIFDSMYKSYGLLPKAEHFSCLVDLLGRAGLVAEANKVVRQMPVSECDEAVLGALLGACRVHNDIDIAREMGEELVELDTVGAGSYVLLSNTYATCKNLDEAAHVRRLMKERKLKKLPGISQIEVNMKKHEFYAGDWSHPQRVEIYDTLEERLFAGMKDMDVSLDIDFAIGVAEGIDYFMADV